MKQTWVLVFLLALTACGGKPSDEAPPAETSSAIAEQPTGIATQSSATALPVVAEVPSVPDHNYSANEDGIYLYAQTLSEA
ncbi:hypothetical protein PQU92_08535 [Asticcacaulis sp. BYS171W]|uniref:Uncharacterized protein n=1 Tax=Asticcacaulis aquaticus TaxID=2984212 RepID=A0ABT5HTD4_9CAUL|nr:hypothetical protein [Asticcacaulis aquaticus]MDC7683321.1 hypothetical protein [Asticcacaulis aquaticus]